jgi:hypothetical protein
MTSVSIAALFAATPKSLSGKAPQLFGLFEGGFETTFTDSDLRSEPVIPKEVSLAGSVEDTFYSINIYNLYPITSQPQTCQNRL